MKPQFTILTILLVTAYVGVAFADIREPLSPLAFIAAFDWIGILVGQLMIAFGQGGSANLVRGFLLAQIAALQIFTHVHAAVASGCLGVAAICACLRKSREPNTRVADSH